MRIFFACLVLVVSGCAFSHVTEIGCHGDEDCPVAFYCDPDLLSCAYDCRGDVDCAPDETCSPVSGRCIERAIPSGECDVGESRYCYSGSDESDGVGQCHGSTQYCVADDADAGIWSIDCVGEVTPYPWGDIPDDGIDNDCDDLVDETEAAPALTIRLSPETPESTVIHRNATGASYVTYDFVVGDASVRLNGFVAHRVHIGAASDFENVFAFDAETGERLTTGHRVDPDTGLVSFNLLSTPVDLDANTIWSVTLVADMRESLLGDEHAFEIRDASAIVLEGGGLAAGDFPVRGNKMTIGYEGPRVDIRLGEYSVDLSVGESSGRIGSFTLASRGGDTCLDRIVLTQAGSASPANMPVVTALLVDAVALPTYWDSEGRLVIDPIREESHGSGACLSESGGTYIAIYAEIEGPADRSFRFYVEYPSDVTVVEATTWDRSIPVAACISPLNFGGCSAEGQGAYDGSAPGTASEAWIR
jgi:hypothetical protein